MAKVTFLGLGVMGYPIAGHLVNAGHSVTVYNRTTSKAEKWVKQFGGELRLTPCAAVASADFVLACVGNDEDLFSVVLGTNGALAGMKPDSVFIDHSTVSANCAKKLYKEAKEFNVAFVDAPVSGGQAGAENGQLVIMCGGDLEAYQKVEPVILSYAKKSVWFGDSGAGQLTKMVNQICIAGLLQGLSEGLNFAEKSGLDCEAVVNLIGGGAAGSWQMVNRYKTMLDDQYDHGFAVDWMRKDLRICLDAADEIKVSLPVTALIDQFYKEIQNMGGGRWDTSSLLKLLRK
ncbi:MAG: NAD(P)-dependent oxidoreductase [Aestuariivita sp.]|nr:NAD(P)-dependent oxidoreductase [Aestuariivita sp.]